jgi:hypothetical protein
MMMRMMMLALLGTTIAACSASDRGDQSVTGTGGITTGQNGPGGDGDGGIKFDTEADGDAAGNGGDGKTGCEKVDFLFVIDNSGSMQDEQQNLINSFPAFIDEIQNTLMAQDYQILATDTDAGGAGGCFQSTCCNVECQQWCVQCQQQGCNCQCNNQPCPAPPQTECDEILGAGKTKGSSGMDCGIAGGKRYIVDGQPNLTDTFACAALVGTGGDGNERPMQSVMNGITDLSGPG